MAKGARIKIDFDKLDELLEAGCDGTEIAAHYGCNEDTLYLRVKEEKGMAFSAYKAQKRAVGLSCIKKMQHELALSGDKSMLIWLGKQYLNQREKTDVTSKGEQIIDKSPATFVVKWKGEEK